MFPKLFSKLPFIQSRKIEADKTLREAELKAKEIVVKAKEDAIKIETDAEKLVTKANGEALELQRRLRQEKLDFEQEKSRNIALRSTLEKEKEEISIKREEALAKLEKIAGLSPEEAKNQIFKTLEDKLAKDMAMRIKEVEQNFKQKADDIARQMLVDAMRYGAVDYTAEYTLSSITLPSDDYKGRIIGKDGRNIRSFEIATGVDVDLEEPGVIKFSSFDAVRREIARVSMERLIRDGRIQPVRIEEIVHHTRMDLEKIMYKAGEELCQKSGCYNLPPDLVGMLGRFKYRYSYGQNMILHTLEETKMGIALAHELGANVDTVRLGCLLHDIGKIVTDKEGSHVTLGIELCEKYRMSKEVIGCVAAHHEDVPFPSIEAVIVYIVDAISGGRPGARHEDVQEYIKRIADIEDAAKKQPGVIDVYALQAGRELRVVVRPDVVSEDQMIIMAQNIKEDIEKKFPTFPGQVNITVLRESRASLKTHG